MNNWALASPSCSFYYSTVPYTSDGRIFLLSERILTLLYPTFCRSWFFRSYLAILTKLVVITRFIAGGFYQNCSKIAKFDLKNHDSRNVGYIDPPSLPIVITSSQSKEVMTEILWMLRASFSNEVFGSITNRSENAHPHKINLVDL